MFDGKHNTLLLSLSTLLRKPNLKCSNRTFAYYVSTFAIRMEQWDSDHQLGLY